MIELVKELRKNYHNIKHQLPWLDSCAHENDKPVFALFTQKQGISSVKAQTLKADMQGRLKELKNADSVRILRYAPKISGSFESLKTIISEMIENGQILSILHTDMEFKKIADFANEHPSLNIMIESGPKKILYFFDQVKETLLSCDNVYLCTYNFCNWRGIEDLYDIGLSKRLLFGSHSPRFSSDVAMGPIIMAQLPWEIKCDIAGNNMRRLLGEDIIECAEVKYTPVAPFMIDTHAHNLDYNDIKTRSTPPPEVNFSLENWTDFLDYCAMDILLSTPMDPLYSSKKSSKNCIQDLREHNPKRFFYYEVFNPTGDQEHVELLKESLSDPACIGIKIHPSFHKVEADDDSYEDIWKIVSEFGKPMMSHSWDASGYNPVQYMSHPNRFRKYLDKYPEVKFVLGHAGGRSTTFEAVVEICKDYSNVWVDISGDYYDNGLINALANGIGVNKILFASDIGWMDPRRIEGKQTLFASDIGWMDPRCHIGMVLGSDLKNEDLCRIFRQNALDLYL